MFVIYVNAGIKACYATEASFNNYWREHNTVKISSSEAISAPARFVGKEPM